MLTAASCEGYAARKTRWLLVLLIWRMNRVHWGPSQSQRHNGGEEDKQEESKDLVRRHKQGALKSRKQRREASWSSLNSLDFLWPLPHWPSDRLARSRLACFFFPQVYVPFCTRKSCTHQRVAIHDFRLVNACVSQTPFCLTMELFFFFYWASHPLGEEVSEKHRPQHFLSTSGMPHW